MIEVRTQAQLDKALKETNEGRDELIVCLGDGSFVLGGNSTVEAWGNSTVEAWGNSTVRAWGNSTVRAGGNSTVEAGGNSTVRAGGNSTVRAWGNSTVEAWGNSTVEAAKHTPVIKSDRAKDVKITGGVVVDIPTPTTAEEWCDFHNVEVRKGGKFSRKLAGRDVAILFKALDDDFRSGYEFAYTPGTAPEAPDWDGGKRECGRGLHFSPTPWQAKEFARDATRFVACPVLVADIAVHPEGYYPQKVKAPRLCAPCWEVDIDGEPAAENNESEEER